MMSRIKSAMAALAVSAGLVFAGLSPSVAHAQSFDNDWTLVTTAEGCIFYEQRYIAEMNEGDHWTWRWSGGCPSGQTINGTGTLTGTTPAGDRNDITGRFVNGYKDGLIRFVRTNSQTISSATAASSKEVSARYNMGCGRSFDRPDQCRPGKR